MLASIAALLFAMLALEWGGISTAPSDPLEYAGPALSPKDGFPFIDRIALWLWLRAFAPFVSPDHLAPVATLAQSALIQWIAVYWLARNFSIAAGACFASLYMLSPFVVGIATYTYPMQLMTLVLVGVAIVQSRPPSRIQAALSGIGLGVALFCKIQALGIAPLVFVRTLLQPDSRGRIAMLAAGGFGAVIALALVILVLDGPTQFVRIYRLYFLDGAGALQLRGYALGGMPPFLNFAGDPSFVLAAAGAVLPWLSESGRRLRIFSLFAVVQSLFLVGVYVVTQRGGSLIFNYSFDAVVFGLIAFSGIAGRAIARWIDASRATVCVVLCYLIVECLARFEATPSFFYAERLPTLLVNSQSDWLAWVWAPPMVLLVGYLLSLRFSSWRPFVAHGAFATCGAVFVVALLYSGKGPAHASYHRNWNKPYQELSRLVLSTSGKVCLDVVLLDSSRERAQWRIHQLSETLYRTDGIPKFADSVDDTCDVILTDQIDRYLSSDLKGASTSSDPVFLKWAQNAKRAPSEVPLLRVDRRRQEFAIIILGGS